MLTLAQTIDQVQWPAPTEPTDDSLRGIDYLPDFFEYYRGQLDPESKDGKVLFCTVHALGLRYSYVMVMWLCLTHVEMGLKLAEVDELDEDQVEGMKELKERYLLFKEAVTSTFGQSFIDAIPVPYLGKATETICAEALAWADSYEPTNQDTDRGDILSPFEE